MKTSIPIEKSAFATRFGVLAAFGFCGPAAARLKPRRVASETARISSGMPNVLSVAAVSVAERAAICLTSEM
jgi:hypothetical protein